MEAVLEPGINWEMWNTLGIWGLVFSPLGFMVFLYWLHLNEGEPKKEQELETEQSSPPRRLLIPFSLSAEEALAAVKAHLLDDSTNPQNTHKIPKGLYKCEQCGEYKGRVKERDLLSDELGYETENGNGFINVDCICDGILCHKCKKNKIHRPISNSYDEKDNDIIHHPYFIWMLGCTECRKNKKETAGQDLPILYPKEIQRLLKIRKIFEQKNELEKAQHKHLWSPAIIPPSSATRNNRKTEVCFQCGQIGKEFEDTPPLTKMRWVKSFAKWLMGKNESL